MYYDIRQYIYGANLNNNSDDTVYSWSINTTIFEAIYDTGGTDTLDFSNQEY